MEIAARALFERPAEFLKRKQLILAILFASRRPRRRRVRVSSGVSLAAAWAAAFNNPAVSNLWT